MDNGQLTIDNEGWAVSGGKGTEVKQGGPVWFPKVDRDADASIKYGAAHPVQTVLSILFFRIPATHR